MVETKTIGSRILRVLNAVVLILLALLCLLPVLHVLALSLSSSSAVTAGRVTFWPVDFTLNSYQFAVMDSQFLRSFGISVTRVLLGVSINMVLIVITAYPLSKTPDKLHGRNIYMGYFFLTMQGNG